MMHCNTALFAKDFFIVCNKKICGEILADHPMELCAKAALKLIHKTICTKRQAQLFNQLKFNSKHRSCSKIGLKCNIRKEVNKQTLLYKATELFNSLKPELKYLSIKKFKHIIKKLKIRYQIYLHLENKHVNRHKNAKISTISHNAYLKKFILPQPRSQSYSSGLGIILVSPTSTTLLLSKMPNVNF